MASPPLPPPDLGTTTPPTRPGDDRPSPTNPGPTAPASSAPAAPRLPPLPLPLPLLAPAASAGFRDAAAYDAHRPAYPREAVGRLLGRMRLLSRPSSSSSPSETGAGRRVVEVAAGTGKLTEALAAAAAAAAWGEEEEEERGPRLEVLATEPHPEMRRALEAKGLPGVTVRAARAEDLGGGGGVEEGWGDGVVAAQAFHWFATDEALREIHRVLKPGGVFGMIWNIDDYNKPKSWRASTAWAQHLNDWIHSLAAMDDNKRFRDMEWQDVFARQSLFSVPLGEDTVGWTHWLSEEALWRRINTLSHVALLEGQDREDGERAFREAMGMDDVVRNETGEVECHGRTYLAWTERIG